ncbi:MAG: hypothetical protein KAW12_03595 [Candidatus Aminicenantes bacterium]|nr:hypothetical protein [Candidatus Aminicenantes bacterium]
MKRVKIGDIIEVETKIGFAYAQYTHKHKMYGALIRVFDKIFESRPKSFKKLILENVRFSTFFPLQAAISKKIFEIVCNEPVRPDLHTFPTFRGGLYDPITKKTKVWWLWDGEKEWKIGDLKENQRKLSILEIWNDTLLIDRIESGWRPEMDEG